MENFTPVSALLGGMLIGFAALLLLWWQGRIAGISGILSGVLTPVHHEWLWRVCFVLGLIVGGEIGFSLLWIIHIQQRWIKIIIRPRLLRKTHGR